MMFSSRLECLALIAVVHSGIAAIANAQSPQPIPHPCNTMAEAKQFDFWIGVWDVTPWNLSAPTAAQQMGVNDVHAILEHCAVSENWKGARGGEGKSSRCERQPAGAEADLFRHRAGYRASAVRAVRGRREDVDEHVRRALRQASLTLPWCRSSHPGETNPAE